MVDKKDLLRMCFIDSGSVVGHTEVGLTSPSSAPAPANRNRPADARSGARRRGMSAAPEEIREPPEHAGGRRPTPRLRAIAHRKVGDERRAEGDGEAGVGPLLEPRRA